MATTPATTATMTTRSSTTWITEITPVVNASTVRAMAPGKPSMIEKKISSDAPLPMPRSVICSPSHITKIAPVVRTSDVESRNVTPGFWTAPQVGFWRNTA